MKGVIKIVTPHTRKELPLLTLTADEVQQKSIELKESVSKEMPTSFAVYLELQSKINEPGFDPE